MKHQKMRERTLNKLIESGILLISEQGYGNMTINQIVTKANLSKDAFCAHFPAKEIFLMKIISEGIEFYTDTSSKRLQQ
ncbi:transcriptional regulator, TetR family [Seinonella peptonophila]|uniref:Transcriptional regulator, TetR family n=1 Tax=Seinonella peptonophila TaxID=112248 RepID=A0A1M5A4U7_9BACL|nr:TetR/AcrR family transcriptional regulator [Seinonella peptonophila]SHF25329.1 transcriptional regulator, TetR family [Seinonella peptonophila]